KPLALLLTASLLVPIGQGICQGPVATALFSHAKGPSLPARTDPNLATTAQFTKWPEREQRPESERVSFAKNLGLNTMIRGACHGTQSISIPYGSWHVNLAMLRSAQYMALHRSRFVESC